MFLAVPVVTMVTIIINDILDEKLKKQKINKILKRRKKYKHIYIYGNRVCNDAWIIFIKS